VTDKKKPSAEELIERITPRGALKKKILVATRRKPQMTLIELGRLVPAPIQDIEQAIFDLRHEGYEFRMVEERVERDVLPPPAVAKSHFWRIRKSKPLKIGIVTDTHIGSIHARLDALNTAYDHFAAEGINRVYHGGNFIDGYKVGINEFELVEEAGPSIERQINYAARVYPKRPKIKTHFITGCCHEGWWIKKSGLNIGRLMASRFTERGRDDLEYLGHLEADIELRTSNLPKKQRGPIMRIFHPGGGSAYALSYKSQKISESYQGGEKPQIQVITHFHKFDYNYAREIHNVLGGCLQDQTTFMRKKHIEAHVGYLIFEIKIAADGAVESFKPEWKPFYDRGFYKDYEPR
jgi:hypothetical protein